MSATIVIRFVGGREATVDLDAASIITVDGPRDREPGETQSRDSFVLQSPLADVGLVNLALDRGVLTAAKIENGTATSVDLPLDAASHFVTEGPGRVGVGLDFVNRVTRRVSLAGVKTITYAKVA